MAIPEAQLQTWSNPGAQTTAMDTHNSVRQALASSRRLHGIAYEVYLQGSYRNATNIRGDSDVDIVAQLNGTADRQSWNVFHAAVLAALADYYGSRSVDLGNKAIKVLAGPGRLNADVVPCVRYYPRASVEGMAFVALRENRWVINYPKQHISNGQAKNTATREWYKSSVRMFKNARQALIDRVYIYDGNAPSYFLECLMYNVPNGLFTTRYSSIYHGVVQWLVSADISRFTCQNGQVYLFGDTPEQWSIDLASRYINGLANLWNNWNR